ncbi:oxygen sensor histidine kinase NreB, partial [Haematococcus lacustris]
CATLIPKNAMSPPGPRRRAGLAQARAIRSKLSPTELPALESALATPQPSSRGASTWGLGRGAQQQLSMDQQQLQGAQHQVAQDQQQLQDAQHQLSLNQQELHGAHHQLAVDQQLLQDAQRQVALDRKQLQGANKQLAQDLEQLQDGMTGLERSELLLRQQQQHMDAWIRAPTMSCHAKVISSRPDR